MIRDVNKNKIFSEMFTYYTSSVNYDTIKYKDNTNSKIYEFSLLTTFLLAILVILIIIFLIFFIKKKKEAPQEKYVDVDEKTYTLEKMQEFIKRI